MPSACSSGRSRRRSRSIGNVKEMTSAGFEGGGYVLLEFEAGFNADVALQDVRAKVDDAQRRTARRRRRAGGAGGQFQPLPGDHRHARRRPFRTRAARHRQAGAGRARADPGRPLRRPPGHPRRGGRDHRRADAAQELRRFARRFRAGRRPGQQPRRGRGAGGAAGPLRRQGAGADRDAGGRAQHPDRRLECRGRSRSATSPTIRPTFKDATSITRVDGQPAVAIEVSKRAGANLIETVDGVKAAIDRSREATGRTRFRSASSRISPSSSRRC